MSDLRTMEVEDLLTVLVGIDDADTAFSFFEDVMTIREIREISQRLQVARMLDEGKPYTAIEKQTGASATTIARVSKALNYGSGGYRAALDLLKAQQGQ
jgi:TrpR-related protein YerC/YecD